MSEPTVLFRCRASPSIGIGHLARSASLAAAVRARSATAVLALAGPTESLTPWLDQFDEITGGGPDAIAADVIVDDHPNDGSPMNTAGAAVSVKIDDGPSRALDVDMVINPNVGAVEGGYEVRPGGAVLAGGRYALLPRAYAEARSRVRPMATKATRLLVTCGGSDPAQATERVLSALPLLTAFDIRVVVGPLNSRAHHLAAAAAAGGAAAITDCDDLIELALWCDLAVTTLGATAAEFACLGVPNLAMAVNHAQLPHLARYAQLGVVHSLGWHESVIAPELAASVQTIAEDAGARADLRQAGQELVDGEGTTRAAAAILESLKRSADNHRRGS